MKKPVFYFLAALMLTACATQGTDNADEIFDPFEGLNRNVYGFNESLDKAIVGPAAQAYNNNVPKDARNGIGNFVANANAPVTFVNDLLQAKPGRAAQTFSRFIINSTVGLGGFFDVAGKSGLDGHTEDFGQTLGVWGVPMGAYVVAPLIGPSNIRDTVGTVVDVAFDPLTWVSLGSNNLNTFLNGSISAVGAIDTRAGLEPAFENLRAQPEPYIALRRAYANQRQSAVRDGIVSDDVYDDLPDFDDFDDFGDFDDVDDFEDE